LGKLIILVLIMILCHPISGNRGRYGWYSQFRYIRSSQQLEKKESRVQAKEIILINWHF